MLPSLLKNFRLRRDKTKLLEKSRKELLLGFKRRTKIGIGNLLTLNKAFTHSSYVNERKLNESSNETMEFVGDSVLGLIVSDYLYRTFPALSEGILSQLKSVVVSAPVLAEKAKELNLGDYLLLGKGEDQGGARNRPSLLADTLEAVIGALYLEGDLKETRGFVLDLFVPEIQKVYRDGQWQDFKSLLQEVSQKQFRVPPHYELIASQGPDHDKTFIIKAMIRDRVLGEGKGKSKKEAEQSAAKKALLKLQGETAAPKGQPYTKGTQTIPHGEQQARPTHDKRTGYRLFKDKNNEGVINKIE